MDGTFPNPSGDFVRPIQFIYEYRFFTQVSGPTSSFVSHCSRFDYRFYIGRIIWTDSSFWIWFGFSPDITVHLFCIPTLIVPNKALQLTPSRDALLFHDRPSSPSTPSQEFSARSG